MIRKTHNNHYLLGRDLKLARQASHLRRKGMLLQFEQHTLAKSCTALGSTIFSL